MCLCLETIKVFHRTFYNLFLHEERMRKTQRDLFQIMDDGLQLRDELVLPEHIGEGLYKCRILYDKAIRHIEFVPYVRPGIRTVRLVQCDECEYSYKYAERTLFTVLKENVEEDEILIVKNGLITDCSFANVVFDDGKRLVTPARPLLCGTKRELLLREKKIQQEDISPDSLSRFQRMFLINAMIDLEDNCSIPISQIYPFSR